MSTQTQIPFTPDQGREVTYAIPTALKRHWANAVTDFGGCNLHDADNQWIGGVCEAVIVDGPVPPSTYQLKIADARVAARFEVSTTGATTLILLSEALAAVVEHPVKTTLTLPVTDFPTEGSHDARKQRLAAMLVEQAAAVLDPLLSLASTRLKSKMPSQEVLDLLSALAPVGRERFEVRTATNVPPPRGWKFTEDSLRWLGEVPPVDGQQVYVVDTQSTRIELALVQATKGYSHEPVDYYRLAALGGRPDIDHQGVLSVPEQPHHGAVVSGSVLPRTPMADVLVRFAVNAVRLYEREGDRRKVVETAFKDILQPLVDQAMGRTDTDKDKVK